MTKPERWSQRLIRTVDAWERLIRQLPAKDWAAEIVACRTEVAKTETPAFANTVAFALKERLLKTPRQRHTL